MNLHLSSEPCHPIAKSEQPSLRGMIGAHRQIEEEIMQTLDLIKDPYRKMRALTDIRRFEEAMKIAENLCQGDKFAAAELMKEVITSKVDSASGDKYNTKPVCVSRILKTADRPVGFDHKLPQPEFEKILEKLETMSRIQDKLRAKIDAARDYARYQMTHALPN